MSNIKIPRKLFEREIGKLDDKMQDKVAMFGTTVESLTDSELEIEVTPDRPDMLSYQGFKRSFLAFLGKKTGIKKYKINKPEKNYNVIIDSSVKNIRPYTACAIVKGIKFDDEKIKEIIDIQEKLHLTLGRKRKKFGIGIYPLEKIKLPITYKAMEPDKIRFVPLESEREMSGLEILQRHPTGRDYAHLLAGKTKFPIFVDANNQVMSIPPIINSNKTGKITEKTKDVFVECSGFDFDLLKKCLNIIVTCLADMGGKVYSMDLRYRKKEITPDLSYEKKEISIKNAEKLLGINLSEKQVKSFLERMGYDYDRGNVSIPSWRTDILHEVDLIEDVAIAYGYENFIPEIPKVATIGEEARDEISKRKFAEILTGLKLLETSSYHLTTKSEQFKNMNIEEPKTLLEVEDSKTDYKILRENLSHILMRLLSENKDCSYPQKIFEIGKVFELKNNKIEEKDNLACAVTPGNFTDAKQILEYFFRAIGLKIEFREAEKPLAYFVEGRCAEVLLDDLSIGYIGEISPRILKNWKIKMPVALFEIELENVFEKLG